MKKMAQFRLWLGIFIVLIWVGCGPPPITPETKPEATPEILQAPSESTQSGPRSLPQEGPSDKPNDPSLFDTGSSSKWIGSPCKSDADCSFSNGRCYKASVGFANGYCTRSCTKYCPDRSGQPYTFCVRRNSKGSCFSRCDKSLYPGNGCRTGYKCQTERRYNSSTKKSICVPDKSIPAPRPPVGGTSKWIGESCTRDSECNYSGGFCRKVSGTSKRFCSRKCTRTCPDKTGKPITFCVNGSSGGVCVSRCDYLSHSNTGCPSGLSCKKVGRYGYSSTTRQVCVSGSGTTTTRPPTPPPSGDSLKRTPGLSCYAQLTKWGIKYNKLRDPNKKLPGASKRCSIKQAMSVNPTIMGVRWVRWTGQSRNLTLSCELAIRLAQYSYYLKKHRSITKVVHIGTYVCRKIKNTTKLSNHSFGSAIDIAAFYSSNGTEYNLEKHWDHSTTWRKNGNMGCWSSRFKSTKAKFLYEVGCDMWKRKFFSLVLTPNFNRAHDNHFHVDLSSSGRILSDVGFIGKDDEH